jgi:hypothetical protein
VVVADRLRNDVGEVIGTHGFYVDVTRSTEERETAITEAVAQIAEDRSIIEQVKGVLMMVYGIDADAAFDVLKSHSRQSNIKLRLLAEQMMSDFHCSRTASRRHRAQLSTSCF